MWFIDSPPDGTSSYWHNSCQTLFHYSWRGLTWWFSLESSMQMIKNHLKVRHCWKKSTLLTTKKVEFWPLVATFSQTKAIEMITCPIRRLLRFNESQTRTFNLLIKLSKYLVFVWRSCRKIRKVHEKTLWQQKNDKLSAFFKEFIDFASLNLLAIIEMKQMSDFLHHWQ